MGSAVRARRGEGAPCLVEDGDTVLAVAVGEQCPAQLASYEATDGAEGGTLEGKRAREIHGAEKDR